LSSLPFGNRILLYLRRIQVRFLFNQKCKIFVRHKSAPKQRIMVHSNHPVFGRGDMSRANVRMGLEANLLLSPINDRQKTLRPAPEVSCFRCKRGVILGMIFLKWYKEKACVEEKKGEGSSRPPIHSSPNPSPVPALSLQALSGRRSYGNPRLNRLFQQFSGSLSV
jgi:hypothetical protein